MTTRSARFNARFGLLLVLMLSLMLWRISLESSLWCDEIYSVLIAGKPTEEILDQTAADRHPPGYYLVLKSWLVAGKYFGMEPGVFWGRLPGVVGWLGLAASGWLIGRRIFGRSGGLLIACSVAIAAQSAMAAKDMRPYAIAYPALFACFLLLLALQKINPRAQARQAAKGWILYAACAAVALWSHMLAAPVLGLFAIMWLGLLFGIPRGRRRGFMLGGLAAQSAALLIFAPWIPSISANIHHLLGERLWMTPPTMKAWSMVFTVWYPFGRHGGESFGWMACGLVTIAVPAFAVFITRRPDRHVPARWKRLAAWGIALALANVTLLWLLDRSGAMLVFHGPRYTVFTVAPWACGLIGLSQWARIRADRPQWFAWMLMSPWFAASVVGLATDQRIELNQGFATASRVAGDPMPAGKTVYVLPSELISFQSRTLGQWDARPIERITDIPPAAEAWILILNNWQALTTERDMVVLSQLKSNRLARSAKPSFMPPQVAPFDLDYVTLLHAQGWNHELARQLAAGGFRTKPLAAPDNTLIRIHPRNLWMSDGWHFMQTDAELQGYCWSAAEDTIIRLPGALKAGRYAIHVTGYRTAMEQGATTLRVRLPNGLETSTRIAEGPFDVTAQFVLDMTKRDPKIGLNHPVHDANRGKANMAGPWMVGIALYGMWLERNS